MNAMLWMVWGWLWAGAQFPHQALTQAVQSLATSLATERTVRQQDLVDEVQLINERRESPRLVVAKLQPWIARLRYNRLKRNV